MNFSDIKLYQSEMFLYETKPADKKGIVKKNVY